MKKTRKKSQRSKSKKSLVASGGRAVEVRASGELNRVNERAAGIDVGGKRHYVAVPPGSSEHPVREFGVFTKELVDARKVKNVSGRKTDVLDCQWLQQLESYGLLQAAYRPADEIVVLRSYVRQCGMLVNSAAIHIQHNGILIDRAGDRIASSDH
jgi:transposase